ncbi:MAG: transposase [Pseudonocardiales bacterium]|nr:transposase [Pseudonocardiales bacterium]
MQGLVTQIDALSEAIREQRAAHIDGHIFTSLPRSGTVRAARLLAEIGDARGRFPTPEALACDTAFTNTTYSTPIPGRLSPVTASLPPREHAEADLQANAPAHAETIAIPQQQTESPNRGKSGAGDRRTPLAASGTGSRRRRRTTCLLGAVGVFTVLVLIPATRPLGAVMLLVVLSPCRGSSGCLPAKPPTARGPAPSSPPWRASSWP